MNNKTIQHNKRFNLKKLSVAMALAVSPVVLSAQFGAVFELSSLDGNNGFVLHEGALSTAFGNSVNKAGDINGDGIGDLIIGAPFASPHGMFSRAGTSYVVFGSNTGFDDTLEFSDLNGNNGFAVNGVDFFDRSGFSVNSAGDINGDGLDDFVIGAPRANPNEYGSGASYVVFGNSTGFASVLELSDLNGSNGFALIGANDENSGFSVSGTGDVNGDGLDDLLIGAYHASPNGNLSGASYVVFGSSIGFDSAVELSDLNGSNGFKLNGVAIRDNTGNSVSSAGDINGDGFADLLIGAYGVFDSLFGNIGASYVVFGGSTGFASVLELSDLNGSNGFTLKGVPVNSGRSGISVSSAGDINGDGLDDLVIGAYRVHGSEPESGASYVVFGSRAGFGSVLELSDLNGNNGFVLNGATEGDRSGISVSSAGDFNGDGLDDLIIGAYLADSTAVDSGASYVVFGNSTGFSSVVELADLDGTNGFVLNGVTEGDRSGSAVSGAGDINGDGLDDVIIGAKSASLPGTLLSYVVFGRKSDVVFADGFE